MYGDKKITAHLLKLHLLDERAIWSKVVLKTQIDYKGFKLPLEAAAVMSVNKRYISLLLLEKKGLILLFKSNISEISALTCTMRPFKLNISFCTDSRNVSCDFKRLRHWKKMKEILEAEGGKSEVV